MNKKDFIRKITSRKFFAMLSVAVVAVILLFRVDSEVAERIGAAIVLLGDVVAYVFAESIADAARAQALQIENTKEPVENTNDE